MTPDYSEASRREQRKREIRLQCIQIPPTPDFDQDVYLPSSPSLSPVSGSAPDEPHERALALAVYEWQAAQERGKQQQKRKLLQQVGSPRSPMRSPQQRNRNLSTLLSPKSPAQLRAELL